MTVASLFIDTAGDSFISHNNYGQGFVPRVSIYFLIQEILNVHYILALFLFFFQFTSSIGSESKLLEHKFLSCLNLIS